MKINFLSSGKILILVGNIFILVLLSLGFFIWDITDQNPVTNLYYFLLLGFGSWIFSIYFIGKFNVKMYDIPKVILLAFAIKFTVIIFFEVLNNIYFPTERYLFLGYFDFTNVKEYAIHFLEGEDLTLLIGGESVSIYYPPGSGLLSVLITLINPFQSTTFYRILLLFFEMASSFLIFKIVKLPKLNIPEKYQVNGVIYSLFALSFLYALDFYGKYDSIILFLTILGTYLFFRDNLIFSAGIFAFSALVKLYPIMWLIGMFFVFMKRKEFEKIKKILIGSIISGILTMGISIIFEGFKFFEVLLSFKFQLFDVHALYNQNVWFLLIYLDVPLINLLPFVLLFLSYFIFSLRWKKEINSDFFIITTALTLFFYPSINIDYISWIIPFVCIGMLGSTKKVKFLALLELCALCIELGFNFYLFYNNINWDTIYFNPTVFPPWNYLVWRFTSLGLFFIILLMLILPNKFERFFPRKFFDFQTKSIVS